MREFLLIILTVFVVLSVPVISYILISKNLYAYKIKLDEAESLLDNIFKEKYDLLISTKDIITKKTDIDHKVFSNLKKIMNQKLSVYDFDIKLTESQQLIEQIKEDFKAVASNRKFNEIHNNICVLDEKLEATKGFYNKYAEKLNISLRKQPYKLIAKVIHIEPRIYFKI